MKKHGLVAALTVLGLLVVCLWLIIGGALTRPGLLFHDFLQRQFPAKSSGQVVLIVLDDASIAALAKDNIYYPYPRALYGELMDTAKRLGARAVGFDIIFRDPSTKGPEDDKALADAIAMFDGSVAVVSDDGKTPPTDILQSAKNLSWGHTHAVPPVDGIFRRLKMEGQTFVSKFIASNHSGWIHFPPRRAIEHVPINNVLQAKFDEDLFKELGPKLQDKIWIVATKAVGLLDVKPNPLDALAPGGELPASLISEAIGGSEGVKEVTILNYCLVASLGFLIWIALLVIIEPQRPGILYMIGSSATVIIPVVGSLVAWLVFTAWFDPMPLLFGLFLTTTLHFVYKVRRDWKERLQFAKAIQHSMSPQMLKLIEQGHVEVRRYGEKQDVFIMFSDLIGFTTMSEQVSPEMLVKLMNFYLDEAVKLIIGHSGYVDKFIGDAIMAIWGAPLKGATSVEVDADSALKVAMSFNNVTELCRRTWEKQYGLVLPLGVRSGIHYGPAIVGNFGSHDRFNYTALGDTVNLASRLEGVGKYYNQLITVSGEVVAKASPKLASEFFLVDELVVKGKEKPTKIYTTSQWSHEGAVNKYKTAFEAYRAEKWDEAIQGFKEAELGGVGAAKTLRMRSEGLKLERGQEKFENGIWKLDEK